jgi:uncharacterized membrane protein
LLKEPSEEERSFVVEIKVQKSVFINLSAEEIFMYICDLENMVDWSSATVSIRKTSPGEVSAGATVRATFRFLGRWLNVVFEVVEYRPCRCLTFKSIAGSPPSLFRYQFEPVEGGGTTASEEAVVQIVSGVVDQASPVIASAVARQIEYDLQTLKEILEAGIAFS